MSAVAKINNTEQDFFIYTKGSPETMLNIFDKSTIPGDYDKILSTYLAKGYKVLSIGHRKIRKEHLKLNRHQLQANLIFDGFEIFHHNIKPGTIEALQ